MSELDRKAYVKALQTNLRDYLGLVVSQEKTLKLARIVLATGFDLCASKDSVSIDRIGVFKRYKSKRSQRNLAKFYPSSLFTKAFQSDRLSILDLKKEGL